MHQREAADPGDYGTDGSVRPLSASQLTGLSCGGETTPRRCITRGREMCTTPGRSYIAHERMIRIAVRASSFVVVGDRTVPLPRVKNKDGWDLGGGAVPHVRGQLGSLGFLSGRELASTMRPMQRTDLLWITNVPMRVCSAQVLRSATSVISSSCLSISRRTRSVA